MKLYRLVKSKYSSHPLSGKGASLFPGRWNNRAEEVVYTADSLALSAFELLVNIPQQARKMRYVYFEIYVPPGIKFEEIKIDQLPTNWNSKPPLQLTRNIGSKWYIKGKKALLKVPSAVIPGHFNFVINTNHPEFRHIKVSKPKPFSFDPRI